MAEIIGIIIALTIAIMVGNDASKRQMSGIGWGLGVFFVLIVFLPLYFIVRKPKKFISEQASENQYYQELIKESGGETEPIVIDDKCPACGAKLSNNEKQCPDCGLSLD